MYASTMDVGKAKDLNRNSAQLIRRIFADNKITNDHFFRRRDWSAGWYKFDMWNTRRVKRLGLARESLVKIYSHLMFLHLFGVLNSIPLSLSLSRSLTCS